MNPSYWENLGNWLAFSGPLDDEGVAMIQKASALVPKVCPRWWARAGHSANTATARANIEEGARRVQEYESAELVVEPGLSLPTPTASLVTRRTREQPRQSCSSCIRASISKKRPWSTRNSASSNPISTLRSMASERRAYPRSRRTRKNPKFAQSGRLVAHVPYLFGLGHLILLVS